LWGEIYVTKYPCASQGTELVGQHLLLHVTL
jgi:hypothetical protein